VTTVAVSGEGILNLEIGGLAYDSRRAGPRSLFFAFAGANTSGARFAADALARGAVAVVYEAGQEPEGLAEAGYAWIVVEHGRKALAAAARAFYGNPDEAVAVAGFTGTNGKSTSSMVTDGILRHSGRRTSLINTIGYHLCGEPQPAVNTTPESLDVFAMLAETRARGGTHLTMEISSHALELGRVHGLRVAAAAFLNLTRDHLDFHKTMEAYFAAKAKLFGEEFRPGAAVINADDPWSGKIQVAAGTRVLRFGIHHEAELRATHIESTFAGLRFQIAGACAVESRLVGEINVYNLLAAAGVCRALGLEWEEITEGIRAFAGVPGRFERVDMGQPFLVVVDYAHTDDALRNVLSVARQLLAGRGEGGRLLTVFGCGGDRDRSKRPLMGMAAAEGSDFVVLTSDNPRSEDPLAIMNDALVGLRRYDTPQTAEPDREKAIQAALAEARPGDIVVIAGKGHETYQILASGTIAFDDREVARRTLAVRGYGGGEA
jgi:UDP-N-acetylmuramoyl-L-alanyl-D-glutamate--2,6-diaminopimelate ligase